MRKLGIFLLCAALLTTVGCTTDGGTPSDIPAASPSATDAPSPTATQATTAVSTTAGVPTPSAGGTTTTTTPAVKPSVTTGAAVTTVDNYIIPTRPPVTTTPTAHTHRIVIDKARPVSCQEDGLTQGVHCGDCLEVLTPQQVIPSTGEHAFVDNRCACGQYQNSTGLIYSLQNGQYSLTGIGTCTDRRIVVPATRNGTPVTAIGADAFKGESGFTEIILPASITAIGEEAFYGCTSLKWITLPNNIHYLDPRTFSGCTALEVVNLPSSLFLISYSCFADCTSLKSLTVPDGVGQIRDSAFYHCTSLATISLPDSLNHIGQNVFADCGNTKVIYRGQWWQFQRIDRGFNWYGGTNGIDYFIQCCDGEHDLFGY